jgi:membrane-associated phospholipid phosphatase
MQHLSLRTARSLVGNIGLADEAARPSLREALVVTAVSVVAMVGLYSGLGSRNADLAPGALFRPSTALDDALPLVVPFVWIYYAYFPLTLSLHFVTHRDRRLLYQAFAGYLTLAVAGFAFFALLPSQMPQPSLAGCTTADCAALDLMYRSDEGFNAFPSMHVAYSVFVAAFFWEHARRWSPVPIALAVGIAASTVLCKRHFLVDVPTGAALALAARPVARLAAGPLARVCRVLR